MRFSRSRWIAAVCVALMTAGCLHGWVPVDRVSLVDGPVQMRVRDGRAYVPLDSARATRDSVVGVGPWRTGHLAYHRDSIRQLEIRGVDPGKTAVVVGAVLVAGVVLLVLPDPEPDPTCAGFFGC